MSSERMSPTEALMWSVEKDPALRSDFCNVTILDRAPDPVRLRATVERALVEIPRLAERVVAPPLRLAPPEWRPDPTFDLDHHLRTVALPAPGTTRALLDLAAVLGSAPLDRSRPLWTFTLVEGLEGGRAALLQQVHHTITDGVGGLRLSLSLVDLERNPTPTVHDAVRELNDAEQHRHQHELLDDPVDRDSPIDVLRDAIEHAVGTNADLVRRGVQVGAHLLTHPTELPARARDAAALAASVRRQVFVTDRAHSRLLAARSLARRYDVLRVEMEPLQRAARALDGSLNDVFVTAIAGGLGLYHERMGEPVDDLRMAMPVSTRGGAGDTGANRFAPTRVVVPVVPKDPAARFALVRQRTRGLRDEPAVGAADLLAGMAVGLPTSILVNVARSQVRTIDFATSNLRGSPVELFLAGARIEASYPMGPRSGAALNVTLLSYCGHLDLGFHSDPAAVTDPEALVACCAEAFDHLATLA